MTPTPPTEARASSLIRASLDRPGDDPIFALNAEAVRRAGQGEDVLNSTIGALTNDDGTLAVMPSVFEALRDVPPAQAAGYAPISGPPAFLDAVIADMFEGTDLARFAVAAATPGGTGACHHAIVNFAEPGERVLTSSYYWGPYGILAEHTRRRLDTFSMFRADGGFDDQALRASLGEALAEQGRALIFLNTPCHNPTGFSLDEDDWSRLTDVVISASEKGPVTLLLDFAYAKFAAPGSFRWPKHVARLVEAGVTVLFAWTASKAFAQYGSRVGALVALQTDEKERVRIKNAIGYSCRGTWSNCNHLGMLAITRLLTDPELRARSEAEREDLRQLLHQRVEAFNAEAGRAELSYPRYEGGFFVAVFTPDAQATADAMKAKGVFVVPLEGAVRVALCATPKAAIPRLVDALAEGVRAAGG